MFLRTSGGTLLKHLFLEIPTLQIFALVRTSDQAQKITALGASPLQFNLQDEPAVANALLEHSSEIYNTLPARSSCSADAVV